MKRLCAIALATLASAQALAIGNLADVSVTDRDTGEALSVYRHRGDYWVAGRPGARYAINIRNQGSTRLMAVASVDGVNVITGETAGFGQSGYVFDSWSGYDITGWRKSNAQIAAFTFTSVPRSYAARTGRPDNVGVIGVAVFRERSYPPIAMAQAAPAAPARAEESAADSAGTLNRERDSNRKSAAPSLGTGHGQRETSVVVNVNFEREQSQPNEVIRIRYDSRENLLAMGVIRSATPPRPQPFPGEQQLGFVPDP
ncbi:MAG: hypothetical protein ABI616_06590 [Pseudomonadota bacterium]